MILDIDRRDGGMEMLAALRTDADAALPAELQRHRLSGSTCAVFRHVVRKGDVYPQLIAAREAIFAHYVPRRPQAHMRFPLLEFYPHGLSVTTGSWVDHYFPVEEPSV